MQHFVIIVSLNVSFSVKLRFKDDFDCHVMIIGLLQAL